MVRADCTWLALSLGLGRAKRSETRQNFSLFSEKFIVIVSFFFARLASFPLFSPFRGFGAPAARNSRPASTALKPTAAAAGPAELGGCTSERAS